MTIDPTIERIARAAEDTASALYSRASDETASPDQRPTLIFIANGWTKFASALRTPGPRVDDDRLKPWRG